MYHSVSGEPYFIAYDFPSTTCALKKILLIIGSPAGVEAILSVMSFQFLTSGLTLSEEITSS